MMRIFSTLAEAASEIRRDVYKGTVVESSRVQQKTELHLPGRERTAYLYSIEGGWPDNAEDLVTFGRSQGFPFFLTIPAEDLINWLELEEIARLSPWGYLEAKFDGHHTNDLNHPALRTTIEGNYPAYTYPERLLGANEALVATLRVSPDSRRAFWPIFRPEDSIRGAAPTRIPCSLGYQAMVRRVGESEFLGLYYLERACDFDNFWLTDVWLAHRFQMNLNMLLSNRYLLGQLTHFIVSLHSFTVGKEEIY